MYARTEAGLRLRRLVKEFRDEGRKDPVSDALIEVRARLSGVFGLCYSESYLRQKWRESPESGFSRLGYVIEEEGIGEGWPPPAPEYENAPPDTVIYRFTENPIPAGDLGEESDRPRTLAEERAASLRRQGAGRG